MMNRIARRLTAANEQGVLKFDSYTNDNEGGVFYNVDVPSWEDIRKSAEFSDFLRVIKRLDAYMDDGGQTAVDGQLSAAVAIEKLIPYLKDVAQRYRIGAEQYYAGVTGIEEWKQYEK